MKKDISKRKTPFFCISKGLSNKQKKIRHVIDTLNKNVASLINLLLNKDNNFNFDNLRS